MAITMLLFSCSQYEDINGNEEKSNLYARTGKNYTGEEIFRGLFFFQNDIADGIPHLKNIKQALDEVGETKLSMEELSNISVNYIKNNYPNFFNDLKKKLESGNLYEISDILDFSGKLIEQSALTSEKYQSAFLFGIDIKTNENLRNQINSLDLSTQAGVDELNQIITDYLDGLGYQTNSLIWAFAAAVYFVVGAVSIAVAAYSVYYKVAYWGPRVKSTGISKNLFKAGNNTISVEREIFISELGNYFSNN